MRRDLLTANPRAGDYILSPTGFTWNVLLSTGERGGKSISTGDRDKKTALAKLRSLTKADRADGWETAGTRLFWQITRFRTQD